MGGSRQGRHRFRARRDCFADGPDCRIRNRCPRTDPQAFDAHLEGESLLNDASGLVCMRFAVAAALTGTFSLVDAFGTFLWVAIGGIALGVGVTWIVTVAKNWVSRHFGEESGSQIFISLLITFGAYLLAEHLHCSGILAAVAAGVTMGYVEQTGQALAVTRVRRSAVWDTVQFAANGIMFVLLGEQLPEIVTGAAQVVRETGHHEPVWLLIYVVAVNCALAASRFLWVWTSLRFTLFRAALKGQNPAVPSWRLIAATSLAGVRGTITLAGVLTLAFDAVRRVCVSSTGSSYLPRRRRDHCVVDHGEPQLAVSSPGPEATARAIAARGGGSGARRCGGSRNSSGRAGAARHGRRPRRYRSLCRCWRADYGTLSPAYRRAFEDRGGKGAGAANGRD
jgi:hypothetical protein